MDPIVINLCDEWQSYASFSFLGVYTNKKEFKKIIKELIDDGSVDSDKDFKELDFDDIESLQNYLTYINFNEINLNEYYG